MALAITEARKGMMNYEGGPFGAVICEGPDVLAVCHNTVLAHNDPTCHAEINAIRLACRKKKAYDLSGCVIYSTTEPCPMCFSAIHWARIDTVVFGSGIDDVKVLGFNELCIPAGEMKKKGKSPIGIKKGFMIKECRRLLDEWNDLPGKKVY